jgi:hypothetical protein
VGFGPTDSFASGKLAVHHHHIPRRALEHRTPVQALEAWKNKTLSAIRFIPADDQARLDDSPEPKPALPVF